MIVSTTGLAWIPWAVWSLPVIGGLLAPILAKMGDRIRDWGSVTFALISALLATSMLSWALSGQTVHDQVGWFMGLKAGVLADPLAVLVSNVVAWVSFFIMMYSVGYMHGDPGIVRYWFFMNFFIGNMQLIVLSDNLFQLFFGWEGVGLCSYALIGHWYTDEEDKWVGSPDHYVWGLPQAYSPSHAGMKAFIMTRAGDVAMLAGIFLIFVYARTLTFTDLSSNITWARAMHSSGLLLPAFLLLLGGAIGKSAQFPLHEWLPDAMAGPTSVSALIHAATMVKAGVFLIARLAPIAAALSLLFPELEVFFLTVAAIGGFTAFLAASQALVSVELKKVLAYSTVSQIGYMFLALGASGLWALGGGITGAMFHLLSHAMFKAGLFLVAGFIIHAVESRFMTDMGGLRKHIPQSFLMFLILALSLAGLPPLSGFWSKDLIISVSLGPGGVLGLILMFSGVITALLTAAYSLRMVGLTFLGKPSRNVEHLEEEHVLREAPLTIRVPYWALALGTIAVGLAGPLVENSIAAFTEGYIHFLGVGANILEVSPSWLPLTSSLSAVIIGLLVAYPFYVSFSRTTLPFSRGISGALQRFLWNRWFVNALYYKIFVIPWPTIIRLTDKYVEKMIFDNINTVMYLAATGISRMGISFDTRGVDGVVNAVPEGGSSSSNVVRKANTGSARTYIYSIVIGLLSLVVLVTAIYLWVI